jgi:RimJ/RimL family protein N-acetyltransferase
MAFAPRTITLRDGARVTLRSAAPDDAEAMLRFRREVVALSPFVLTVPEDLTDLALEDQRSSLETFAAHPCTLMLLAFAGGELIGASSLIGFDRAKKRHTADYGAAIAEPWRGRGVGRAMLEILIEWARSNPDLLRLTLDVMADNTRARRMYELAGFRACGHERRAYRQPDGSFADGIKMDMWVG